MVRQYQVVLDPDRLRAYGITQATVIEALQQGQPGDRRLGARAGRGRVHGARVAATCKSLDDFRAIPLTTTRGGDAGAAGRRGARPDRARDAARHRRAGRRGRSRRRRHRHALGQECAARRSTRSRPSSTTLKPSLPPGVEIVPTYDRSQLIDRAVDNLARQADRGVHRRRAGLRRVPVPPALGAGGDRRRCRSACWRRSSSCASRASTPTSCRWAASRSPSARWSMRRS